MNPHIHVEIGPGKIPGYIDQDANTLTVFGHGLGDVKMWAPKGVVFAAMDEGALNELVTENLRAITGS